MADRTIIDVKLEGMRNEVRFSAQKLGHRLPAFSAKRARPAGYGPVPAYTSYATCRNCGRNFTVSVSVNGGGSYEIPSGACPQKIG